MRALLIICLVFSLNTWAEEGAPHLKVLTFNTWLLELMGIKLAPNILERRELIAEQLAKSNADVLNLIEVWQPKNADFLVSRLRALYPYCSFNPDRVRFGALYSNGLLVLSKYPLRSSSHRYKNGCTRPLDAITFKETTRFDETFVSKGAIHNVLIHPELGEIDLYSSHLGALSFSAEKDDYNPKHKQKVLEQSRDLVHFIDQTSQAETQLLMIDTNRHFREWAAHRGESHHLDPSYALFLNDGLRDSFMDANAFDPHTLDGFYTFDQIKNPNAGGGHFSKAPSEFIDYIFVRSSRIKPEASHFAFTKAYRSSRGDALFLSDHFAIESTFGASSEMTTMPLAQSD